MTYRPTPAGLRRDLVALLYVLRVARSNLDRLYPNSEATTTRTCDDPQPAKAST